jgi:hypothetical protein
MTFTSPIIDPTVGIQLVPVASPISPGGSCTVTATVTVISPTVVAGRRPVTGARRRPVAVTPILPAPLVPHLIIWQCDADGAFQQHLAEEMLLVSDTNGNEYAATMSAAGGASNVDWLAGEEASGSRVTFSARLFALPAGSSFDAASVLAALALSVGPSNSATGSVIVNPAAGPAPIAVTMLRAQELPTADQALWSVIRSSTSALQYNNYEDWINQALCPDPTSANANTAQTQISNLARLRSLPFPDADAYRVLKVATEYFLRSNCGVLISPGALPPLGQNGLQEEALRVYRAITQGDIANSWAQYVVPVTEDSALPQDYTFPYLELVRRNLVGIGLYDPRTTTTPDDLVQLCDGIIRQKLTHPCMVELIWSYWLEEGMLVQAIKAIAWRFQNRRGPAELDPLALLEIDPLRPLNSLMWGYIQDEQHRLTVPRRAYEYDHHYGITLLGKAVPPIHGADGRSRFTEGFHNLLYLCSIFFKEDDDTTVIADGFAVLNALRDVHMLLTQGAHNQYGELPWTARQEMLMEQWMMSRPEFREYLPRRVMVDLPEPWMQSVETMKSLQGWTDVSILHFRELAIYGERILLSARFKDWTSEIHPQSAANWARYFRAEIQGYTYAYRAVTGVDLTDHPDATMPSLLLRQRLSQQLRRRLSGRPTSVAVTRSVSAGRLRAGPQPQRTEIIGWTGSEN